MATGLRLYYDADTDAISLLHGDFRTLQGMNDLLGRVGAVKERDSGGPGPRGPGPDPHPTIDPSPTLLTSPGVCGGVMVGGWVLMDRCAGKKNIKPIYGPHIVCNG